MDLVGKKGRLYVAWSDQVQVKVIRKRDFFLMEMQVVTGNAQENLWVILVHTSTKVKIRERQWEELAESS